MIVKYQYDQDPRYGWASMGYWEDNFGPNYYTLSDTGKSFARIRLQSKRPIEKQEVKRQTRIDEWVFWAVGTAASISFGVVILSIVLMVQAASNSDPNGVFTGVVAFSLFSIILAVSLRLSKSIKQFSSASGAKW